MIMRDNFDLSKHCWFKVGGNAAHYCKPNSIEELLECVRESQIFGSIAAVGAGSNIVFSDEGFNGIILKLGRAFNYIEITGSTLTAGAATLDLNVALYAQSYCMEGLEFLSGIPGTIGGALAMNAGAYGSEIKDVLISAEAVHLKTGQVREFMVDDIGYKYRGHQIDYDWCFTKGVFKLRSGIQEEIDNKMREIKQKRSATQPIKTKTGGSTFKNPAGFKAWELIEGAGCRGLKIGGAKVSDLHCNFIINEGDATAGDIYNLVTTIQRRVLEQSGILLEPEIKFIGQGF
jgi:UDP-N-acetylmuramate dehydrogenase